MKQLCQKTPEAIVAPSLAFVQAPSKSSLDKAAPANSSLSNDAGCFQKSPPAVYTEKDLRKIARIILSRAGIAESTPLKCVPHYSVRDHYAVTRVLRGESMWRLDSEGANRLVSTFREKINPAKHLLATATATAGLHVASTYLIQKRGPRVLLPAWTWYGVAATVLNSGGIPVFIDIDPHTLRMVDFSDDLRCDFALVSHLFGVPSVNSEHLKWLRRRNIPLLEDCAQAVQGSIDDNLKIGRLGAAAVYSFNGSKAIPAGEGGMIATNDDDLAKYFFNFTMSVTSPREVVIRRFNDASQGWNYRLSALAASLSESLIHSLPKRIKTARNSCVTIQSLLANRPWLRAIGGQNRPDFAPLGCPTLLCRQATGLSLAESRAVLYFALRFAGFPVSVWVPDSIPDTKLLKNYGNTLITTSKHFANAKSVADGHIIFPTGAGAITGFRNKSRLDRVFDAFERLLG